MCDFETSVSVWTHNISPEWVERNGCSDVRLVDGISRDKADCLVERLREGLPTMMLEIRDIKNVCVWATDLTWIGTSRSLRDRETSRPAKHRH